MKLNRKSFSYKEVVDAKGSQLVIEDGSTVIPRNIFESRDDIYSAVFPDTLKVIEQEAFYYAGLETLELPSSIQEIDQYAFSGNKLTKLKIDNLNLSSLADEAFGTTN